jgi:catechol 2,3-dioxygenase-like lactoylglutathione lyase family enzyme
VYELAIGLRAYQIHRMSIELNHTIVHAVDKAESAKFLTEILGLGAPTPFGHFLVVKTANGVSLDFIDSGGEPIAHQHYAFLVSEAEFDTIFARIEQRKIGYWADPFGREPNRINTHFGGRGCYFRDPSGHLLEIITRPYATG